MHQCCAPDEGMASLLPPVGVTLFRRFEIGNYSHKDRLITMKHC